MAAMRLVLCSTLLLPLACDVPELQVTDLAPTPSLESPEVVTASGVRFNELQPDNDSTVMGEGFTFPDWVELYNAGSLPVDLRALALEDEDGARWEGMEGTLAAGEHLLLWADAGEGADHLPFALSAEGERLTLWAGGVAVDRIATGPLSDDRAWARYPDGGAWQVTALPTPGRSNGTRPPGSDDPSDRLFQAERVQRVQLSIPADGLASLEEEPYLEVPGSFAFEGAWFPQVGVRIKGQLGSLRTMEQKVALKVDLNAYADHELRGLNSLTLNNMVQDPSFVHEHLAYAVYRAAGIPAPRVGWVWLEVNGEAFGLYLLVESIDDRFLARWFADPSGHLYEGSYGQDFDHDDIPALEYDEGPDADDRSALEAVADVLDAGPSEAGLAQLRGLVDVDEFSWNMALESVMLHWDGYTTANNWRFYLDPVSGRFSIIPWGTDQTFVDAWFGPWDGYGRVFEYCLAVESCAQEYDLMLIEAADLLDELALYQQLDPLHTWLMPYIEADPRKETTPEGAAAELEATRATLLDWPVEIRLLVEARVR
jgi:hypothetical protein